MALSPIEQILLTLIIDRSLNGYAILSRRRIKGQETDLMFETPHSRLRITTTLGVLGNDLLFLFLLSLQVVRFLRIVQKWEEGLVKPHPCLRSYRKLMVAGEGERFSSVV